MVFSEIEGGLIHPMEGYCLFPKYSRESGAMCGNNKQLNILASLLLTWKKTSHSSQKGLNQTWEWSHLPWVNTNVLMPDSLTAHPTPASTVVCFCFFPQLNLLREEAGILYFSICNILADVTDSSSVLSDGVTGEPPHHKRCHCLLNEFSFFPFSSTLNPSVS